MFWDMTAQIYMPLHLIYLDWKNLVYQIILYMDDDFFIGKYLNKSNFFYYEENEKRVAPISLLNSQFHQLIKDKNYLYIIIYLKK